MLIERYFTLYKCIWDQRKKITQIRAFYVLNVVLYIIWCDLTGKQVLVLKEDTKSMMEEKPGIIDILLSGVLDNVGNIYMLSPEGIFTFVSQSWVEMLDYDKRDLIGQPYASIIDIHSIHEFQSHLAQMQKDGGYPRAIEYQVKHRDGTLHWVTSRISLIEDEQTNLKQYVAFAADITEKRQVESALRLSEERFSKAFQCNPDPISIATLTDGRYVEINDAWIATTGYQRHEVIGRTVREINIWEDPNERDLVIKQLQTLGIVRGMEINFRHKQGEVHPCLFSAEIIEMDNALHLLAVVKDISQWKKAEEDLRLSEERFSKAFNASPINMIISSMKDGRFIDVNVSFCCWSGYSRDEILNRSSLDKELWVEPVQRKLIKEQVLNSKSVQDWEVLFRKKNGEQRLGLYSAEGLMINNESCLLSIVTDITERKQSEEKIKYLSFHDKLTGLYNRTFIEEEMVRIDTVQYLPVSLIMGDVNGLKLVNDALGHQEGDRLLITVAEILKNSCRSQDIIARWGGDEFIIILPNCDRQTAARVFDDIKQASLQANDLMIETSISMGLATKESVDQDINELIREAEDKMYRNKLMESRSARSAFITSLEKTLWTRSYETEEHCQRVQKTAHKIGQSIDLPESDLDNLKLLASLHDIGKIAIPNSILDKPGRLTVEEWEAIKKHPEIGYRIALSSPEMAPIAEAILHHHEHWNGNGYPLGLKGESIPILSRILAIADTYDVMVNGRSYQPAVSPREVWEELKRCAGTQFDPQLVSKTIEVLA